MLDKNVKLWELYYFVISNEQLTHWIAKIVSLNEDWSDLWEHYSLYNVDYILYIWDNYSKTWVLWAFELSDKIESNEEKNKKLKERNKETHYLFNKNIKEWDSYDFSNYIQLVNMFN